MINSLASIIFILTFLFITRGPVKQNIPQDLVAVMRPIATTIKPFTLTGKEKSQFTNQDLEGKWSFVFFGYTHCPDICPTTLVTLKQINQLLQKHPGAKVAKSDFQVVFVSVDPKRDTPEGLAEYVSFFNKDFIGVTGNSEQIKSFAQQFAAAYILEPADKDVMERKPRDPKEKTISGNMITLIILFGIIMGIGTLFLFNMYYQENLKLAQTIAFTSLVMFEMFAVIGSRSFKPFEKLNPFSNMWLFWAVISSIVIQIIVVYLEPMQLVFGTVPLSLVHWIQILGPTLVNK